MKCIHLREQTANIKQIGLSTITQGEYLCLLKMQSEAKQIEIYQTLFEKGLEGSILSDVCPIVPSNNWNACPYFLSRRNYEDS